MDKNLWLWLDCEEQMILKFLNWQFAIGSAQKAEWSLKGQSVQEAAGYSLSCLSCLNRESVHFWQYARDYSELFNHTSV